MGGNPVPVGEKAVPAGREVVGNWVFHVDGESCSLRWVVGSGERTVPVDEGTVPVDEGTVPVD